MRVRWRLRKSCAISSFIVAALVVATARREEVASDAAQDHALQALEVEEAVGLGGADRLDYGPARVLAQEALEAAQRDRAAAGRSLLERGDVSGDLGSHLQELPFLDGGCRRCPALAARRPVLGQRCPTLAEVLRLLVRADEPGPLEDL